MARSPKVRNCFILCKAHSAKHGQLFLQRSYQDSKRLLTDCREVETLFHEFGHALQHMMTTVNEGLVAGIRGVEWDAVELPSQFMENWCYDKPTLYSFAKHYQTGEPLPEDMFKRLKEAKTFRSGTMMLRQVCVCNRGWYEDYTACCSFTQ